MATDQVSLNGILDNPGNRGVLRVDSETFPKGDVGHKIPLNIVQACVGIAGADPVILVHFPERGYPLRSR